MLNIVKLYDYEYQILYRYYQKYDVSTPWCLSSRWSQGMTSTVLWGADWGFPFSDTQNGWLIMDNPVNILVNWGYHGVPTFSQPPYQTYSVTPLRSTWGSKCIFQVHPNQNHPNGPNGCTSKVGELRFRVIHPSVSASCLGHEFMDGCGRSASIPTKPTKKAKGKQ